MKVLVTGATGIVGSNLVRVLLDGKHEVRVLMRPSSDGRSLKDLRVEKVEGDVLDVDSVAAAARGRTVIFHAAALFSYWGDANEQLYLAERGTRNVLEAAKKCRVRRVVVTSSSVVLGSTDGKQILDEDIVMEEADPSAYTQSKIRQQAAAFRTGQELGVEVVAVLPTLVVGGHDYRLSPSNANVLNYLNDPFRSTFSGGCNIVSAVDVAAGHVLAAQRGKAGACYVVGSENLTWYEAHALISRLCGTFGPSLTLNNTAAYLAATAAEVAARLSGTRPVVTRDEARMAGRFYWYSHRRMHGLGYSPRSAKKALADAIAWLWVRSYISDSIMAKLVLSADVRAARSQFAKSLTS